MVEASHTPHLSLTGYSSVQCIAELLCTSEKSSVNILKFCVGCKNTHLTDGNGIEFAVSQPSTSNVLQARWDEWFSPIHDIQCNTCNQIQQIQHIKLVYHPPGLICFNIYEVTLDWATEIQLVDFNGALHPYKLSGIVYYDGNHFTSRVREINGNIWYIDNLRCSQQEKPPIDLSYVDVDPAMKPYLAVFIRQSQ